MDAYDAIIKEVEQRKAVKETIEKINRFGEEIVLFGLDFDNTITLCLKMYLFEPEMNSQGVSFKDKIYSYIFTITNYMLSDLVKKFFVNNKINFVVDFYAKEFSIEP